MNGYFIIPEQLNDFLCEHKAEGDTDQDRYNEN